jgi:hypothetical protein
MRVKIETLLVPQVSNLLSHDQGFDAVHHHEVITSKMEPAKFLF